MYSSSVARIDCRQKYHMFWAVVCLHNVQIVFASCCIACTACIAATFFGWLVACTSMATEPRWTSWCWSSSPWIRRRRPRDLRSSTASGSFSTPAAWVPEPSPYRQVGMYSLLYNTWEEISTVLLYVSIAFSILNYCSNNRLKPHGTSPTFCF